MGDVLSFQIATPPGGYASVNHLAQSGFMRGKKSVQYHSLEYAVREEARRAMRLCGWVPARYYCEVYWKRYVVDTRGFDAANAMKVELDALQPWEPATRDERACFEPFEGVYTDDCLVKPIPDVPQYDPTPGAIGRIAIAIFRLFPPVEMIKQLEADGALVRPGAPRKKRHAAIKESAPDDGVPERMALLGGKPVRVADVAKYLPQARILRR